MKSIYILHEGNAKKTNDNLLIRLLIEELSKTNSEIDLNKIEFHGVGTKSNFFKVEAYPKDLKEGVKTEQVDKVFFIVDADYEAPNKNNPEEHNPTGGYENTEKALNEIIAKLGFQEISSTYIMCDPDTKTGYLESFILSTIPEKQRHCIERFLDCSQFKSKENHKAILNQIYNIAYPNAPYNFSHSHFDELKTKLINLFQ